MWPWDLLLRCTTSLVNATRRCMREFFVNLCKFPVLVSNQFNYFVEYCAHGTPPPSPQLKNTDGRLSLAPLSAASPQLKLSDAGRPQEQTADTAVKSLSLEGTFPEWDAMTVQVIGETPFQRLPDASCMETCGPGAALGIKFAADNHSFRRSLECSTNGGLSDFVEGFGSFVAGLGLESVAPGLGTNSKMQSGSYCEITVQQDGKKATYTWYGKDAELCARNFLGPSVAWRMFDADLLENIFPIPGRPRRAAPPMPPPLGANPHGRERPRTGGAATRGLAADNRLAQALTVFGLPPNTNWRQIQRTFHRLALFWHPDKNRDPNALATFQMINEAYTVLKDHYQRA